MTTTTAAAIIFNRNPYSVAMIEKFSNFLSQLVGFGVYVVPKWVS